MASDAPHLSPPRRRLAAAKVLVRPALALFIVGCVRALMPVSGRGYSTARKHMNPSVAAAAALAARGLDGKADDIHWLEPPNAARAAIGSTHRFAALAHRKDEPSDVWLGEARLSPEGRFIRLSNLYNLSDSSAVAESALVTSGARIAWAVSDGREISAIKIVELKGRSLPSDWTFLERWQTRLTFLQETGQFSGWCERAYRFDTPRSDVVLAFEADGVRVQTQAKSGVLRCDGSDSQVIGLTAEPSEL